MKYILTILTIVMIVFFSFTKQKTLDNTLSFESSYHKEKFIQLLIEKRIKFSLSDDGVIVYSSADEDRVKLLQINLLNDLSKHSILFFNRSSANRFTNILNKKGIAHKVDVSGKEISVIWNEGDDEEVQRIWENN